MLSKKDLEILRGMFRENNEVFGAQLKRQMRDEIHSVVNGAVAASERRMMERMDGLERQISEVAGAAAELIGEQILPRIENHDERIVRIEHQLKIA